MPPIRPGDPYEKIYLGIDPGASGGIAALYADPKKSPVVFSLKGKTLPQILAFLKEYTQWRVGAAKVYAVIEQVGGYLQRNNAKDQGGAQPGSSMFNFGGIAGALEMGLVAVGLYLDSTYRKVPAATWQKRLGVAPKKRGEPKSAHKNRLKEFAQELFPNVKVTLATADALLLAEYCRRQQEGTL